MTYISRKEAKERGLIRHSETRRVDPAPPPAKIPGTPPHKVPKTYGLEITSTTTTVHRHVYKFSSKREREDFLRNQRKEAQRNYPWRNWSRVDESYSEQKNVDYREFMLNGQQTQEPPTP